MVFNKNLKDPRNLESLIFYYYWKVYYIKHYKCLLMSQIISHNISTCYNRYIIKEFWNIMWREKCDAMLIIKNHDNVYEWMLSWHIVYVYIGQHASREGRLLLSTSSWINLAGISVFWFTPLLHCFESYFRKLMQLINNFIDLLIRTNRYAARVAKCTSRLV